MGVRELWPILEPVGQPVTLSDLQGKTVAIDLSIWIRESDVVHNVGKPYLRNIFWRVSHLLRNQVTPVFVIEGATPILKNAELERRLHGTPKKGISPGQALKNLSPRRKNAQFEEQIQESCQLLDSLGVQYVQSEGEAEATCAQLNLRGVVDGCVTQDGDAFLFGARTVYRNFTCNSQKVDQMSVYHMDRIEKELGLSRKHLVSLAVLVGCDYYPGVKSVGRKWAEEFMKEIKGQDPILKLKELKTCEVYKKIDSFGSTPKRRHCLRCNHPGSKDVHQKLGCTQCKKETGCEENSSDLCCQCPFHKNKALLSKHAVGMKIRRQVLKEPDFPPQKVLDAFLKPEYSSPGKDLDWCKPSIEKLQTFNRSHLHWGPDKVVSRFSPLFTAWDLSHPEETSLLPLRILKIFHERGHKMIEVEWKYEDRSLKIGDNEVVITSEMYDIMKEVHPDLVSGFEEEEQRKKASRTPKSAAKRKMLKAAATNQKIGDIFKKKKPKTEVPVKANGLASVKNKPIVNEEQSPICQSSKKTVRLSLFSKFEAVSPRQSSIEGTAKNVTESQSPAVLNMSDGTDLKNISQLEGANSEKANMGQSPEETSCVDTYDNIKDLVSDALMTKVTEEDAELSVSGPSLTHPSSPSERTNSANHVDSCNTDTPREEDDTDLHLHLDTDSSSNSPVVPLSEKDKNTGVEASLQQTPDVNCKKTGTSDEQTSAVKEGVENAADRIPKLGKSAEMPHNQKPDIVSDCPVSENSTGQEAQATSDASPERINLPAEKESNDETVDSSPIENSQILGETAGVKYIPIKNDPRQCNKEKLECIMIMDSDEIAEEDKDADKHKVPESVELVSCDQEKQFHQNMNNNIFEEAFKDDKTGPSSLQDASPRDMRDTIDLMEDGGDDGRKVISVQGTSQSGEANLIGLIEVDEKLSVESEKRPDESFEERLVSNQNHKEISTDIPEDDSDEKDELRVLRRRSPRKHAAMKSKAKGRKKKLKASAGQPKINDMFSVKEKPSNGSSLKMVLVRKSDL